MADLTQLAGEMIGKNIQDNITTLMKLLNQNVDLNVYHFNIIQRLKSGEVYDADGPLTLDRIQIVGTEVKVLKPKPASVVKTNGRGDTKDVPPLTEQPAEEPVKETEVTE
jgi:hypothetical protein